MLIKGKIMFKKIVLISAVSVAFSTLAYADASTTPTAPTTTKPTVTVKPHGNSMDATAACKKGSGTRVVSYDYDAKTGVISANTTFDKCMLPNGTTISGIASIDGTLQATGETGYTIDLTDQVDTTIVNGKAGLTHTRKCTIATKGTLDTKTQVFSGSIQRNNCELSGDFRAHRGFLEHLLKRVTSSEEDDTDD